MVRTTSGTLVRGHVEEGWGKVADVFRENFEEGPAEAPARLVRRALSTWMVAPSSICGAASPIARRTGRGTRTPSSPSHPRPKGLPRSAPTCWYSAASSISTLRWSSIGRSSALPARSTSRCAGCSHQAGLPVIDGPLTFEEACAWDPVIRALEAQKPEWEPGTEHVYHSVTFGFLVGELVRRITGKSLGASSPTRSLPRSGCTPGSGCPRSKSQTWPRSTTPSRSRWKR